MPALTVINGTYDAGIHSLVEQSSFMEGLLTLSLQDYIHGNFHETSIPVLLFLDQEMVLNIPKDVLKIFVINFPAVLIGKNNNVSQRVSNEKASLLAGYLPKDFSHRSFKEILRNTIKPDVWNSRTMVFADLEIQRACQEVRFRGEQLMIKGFSYRILLVLAEHMGEVVSREVLSQSLPKRKRASLRNIDTHIKQLRQNKGLDDLIRCVRPIGYCLAAAPLYQKQN